MVLILETILFLMFWGIVGYLASNCIIGPLIIDTLGETFTKIINGFISFIFIIFYCLYRSREKKQEKSVQKQNRKTYHLILGILSLLMAPFGFAGMLEGRPNHELNSIWAGLLCLGGGAFLLYSWFQDRK